MIVIEEPDGGENSRLFAGLRRAVLGRFLKTAQRAVQLPGEVNLLLADDARLKSLNKAFRGKNKPTDVLSFPAAENGEGFAGDLAISVETASRQADEHGHSLEDELRVLTLHGMLHLAGYDHEVDGGEMRALESQLREKLKLPGGLIERVSLPTAKAAKRARKAPVSRASEKAGAKKATTRATKDAKPSVMVRAEARSSTRPSSAAAASTKPAAKQAKPTGDRQRGNGKGRA